MPGSDDRSLVPDMLREYGELTRSALRRYLPDKEPRRHLYDLVADYPGRGGKMMRPSICIATTKAFGGSEEDALLCAVSLELFHNAMLVHDDIQDESERRRGLPTMHEMCGVPLAINVGDMLTLLSLRPLFDNHRRLGADVAHRIVLEADRVAQESAEGQAMELGWRADNNIEVSESDYLEMVLKKTCWLAAIYPLRLGALIGTRGRIDLDRFIRFGFFLGAAFQIQDDVLNLFGDDRYGKECNGDLWEGKRTLMIVNLLNSASAEERERVKACMACSRSEKNRREVEWMRASMDRYGSIDYARSVAQGLAGAALYEFEKCFSGLGQSRELAFLRGLATWVFERN